MHTTSIIYSITKRIAIEFLLIVLSILTMIIASAHFKPMIISTTLSPDMSRQEGWPLPFSSSYDEYDNTGSWSYRAQQFNIGMFEVNILVFYAIIRLVMATIEGVIHRHNSRQYKKLTLCTVKHIVVMAIFLSLIYGTYILRVNIINTPQELYPNTIKIEKL